MTNVRQRDVVVLTPEERYVPEWRSEPHHVLRNRLTLTFCDDPVFNTNQGAKARFGIARQVTRSPDARSTCAQKAVDDHAVVDAKSGLLRELGARPHTHAEHDKVRGQRAAICQFNTLRANASRTCIEVKAH